jgi:hypothetical protein
MYQIVKYDAKYKDEVILLFQYIWGQNFDINKSKFEWKYERNPQEKRTIAIVALFDNRVIGFRGFFASVYVCKGKKIRVLSASDALVHPEHRRKGLFSKMTIKAFESYGNDYDVCINMSSNQYSAPGNIKLGFEPIAVRKSLKKVSLKNSIRNWISNKTVFDFPLEKNIEISYKCNADQLSQIHLEFISNINSFCLLKNKQFFEWRFNNGNKYVFICCKEKAMIIGYLVLLVKTYGAQIVDYAEIPGTRALEKLFLYLGKLQFSHLYIMNISLSLSLLKILRKSGFKDYGSIKKRIRKPYGNLHILLRPIAVKVSKPDWFHYDFYLKDINNWHFTGICSDIT